jgi:Icc protein
MLSGTPSKQSSKHSAKHSADRSVERLKHPDDVVHLVQITDTHLCESPGGTLLGMDTDNSLQLVINQVRQERGSPDVLLLTGDLSDHGSASAYRRVADYTQKLAEACYWLPGNHDSKEEMASVLAGSTRMSVEIRIAQWQIIMLDSQIPGQVGGELGAEQLSLLDTALQQAAREGLTSLVCLHHHPIEIGCAWLDEQIVADAEAFFEVLDRHDGVRGVLWGHIHQQVDIERNGVILMGSPSTCVQFAPKSERFKADDLSPGYRWLDLRTDGSIHTGVSRVEGVSFNVDLDSKGYL